jgi:chaperonin GroEL (HSP60 family)
VLNEIDRNLADAMSAARNVFFDPILAPGGGATEMAMYATHLALQLSCSYPRLTLFAAL